MEPGLSSYMPNATAKGPDAGSNKLEARTHRNVLVVALANTLARIAWAVLTTGDPYREGAVG